MFILSHAKSKVNLSKISHDTKIINTRDPNEALLLFGRQLLKNNKSNISEVTITINSIFGRKYTKTIVKQKLKLSYHNGYKYIHLIK